jgi:tetratricopeptide (TPR) repeat protein
VLDSHSHIHDLFRSSNASVAATCQAARDKYASFPNIDPDDPASWDTYRLITSDLQTLLAYLIETGVPSSAPDSFRNLVMRVLYYLSRADRSKLGLILSKAVYREWSEQLGQSHPDVIYVAERQAACHQELGDAQAATALMRKVLAQRKAVLGDAHPSTLRAAANLGTSLNFLEDFHAALRLNQETVQLCRVQLGPDHDATLSAAAHLASSLFGLGEYQIALGIYRDVLARRTAVNGPNARETLTEASNVALTLEKLGDHEAARAMNEQLHHQLESSLGAAHPLTKKVHELLIKNLRALGRTHEADVERGAPWTVIRDDDF